MKGIIFCLALATFGFCKASALVNGTAVTSPKVIDGSASILAVYGDNTKPCQAIMVNSTAFLIPTGLCGTTTTLWVTNNNFVSYEIFQVANTTQTKTSGLSIARLTTPVTNATQSIQPAIFVADLTSNFPPQQGAKCKVYGVDFLNGTTTSLTYINTTIIKTSDCSKAWGSGVVARNGSNFCAYVTTNGTRGAQNSIRVPQPNTLGDYPAALFCQNWGVNIYINLLGIQVLVGGLTPQNTTYIFAGFLKKTTFAGNSTVLPTVYQYANDIST